MSVSERVAVDGRAKGRRTDLDPAWDIAGQRILARRGIFVVGEWCDATAKRLQHFWRSIGEDVLVMGKVLWFLDVSQRACAVIGEAARTSVDYILTE